MSGPHRLDDEDVPPLQVVMLAETWASIMNKLGLAWNANAAEAAGVIESMAYHLRIYEHAWRTDTCIPQGIATSARKLLETIDAAKPPDEADETQSD